MPNAAMKHDKNPRQVILDEIGDISNYEIAPNQILVATYQRPEKTRGGIILTARVLDEDIHQCKAGLVLALGRITLEWSFVPDIHDWVVIRPSDAWALEVNFKHCRQVFPDQIRARIDDPGSVW